MKWGNSLARVVFFRVFDLLLPGLGLVLSGRPAGCLASIVWLGALACGASLVCLADFHPLQGALFAIIAHMGIATMVLLEPLGHTRRPGHAIFVLGALLAAGWVVFSLVLGSFCQPVKVRDNCMFPGLLSGEIILVKKQAEKTTIRLGDLVASLTSSGVLIGRVIGIGGDTLAFYGPSLVRNGGVVPSNIAGEVVLANGFDAAPEETQNLFVYEEELDTRKHPFFYKKGVILGKRELKVPEGHVALVCDNRSTAHAQDSRDIGAIPVDKLIGRAGPVLWSWDSKKGPRWERIGAIWQ